MVTYNCKGCSFSVSHLQITAQATKDGGLRELRAWANHRLVPLQGRPTESLWLQGRSQALFSAPTSPPPGIAATAASVAASALPLGLMVQPWLGLIGSLGTPRFTQSHVNCSHRRYASACAHLTSGVHRMVAVTRGPSRTNRLLQRHLMAQNTRKRGGGGDDARRRSARTDGAVVGHKTHATAYGDAALKYNHSAQVTALDLGGPRLSTTANLLRVRRPAAASATAATAAAAAVPGRCEAYLGIGHLHRGEGRLNRKMKMGRDRRSNSRRRGKTNASRGAGGRGAGAEAFVFGFEYTHFFYTLSPVPPHQLLATSAEFCAGSMQDSADCESVQFILGLTWEAMYIMAVLRNIRTGYAHQPPASAVRIYHRGACNS